MRLPCWFQKAIASAALGQAPAAWQSTTGRDRGTRSVHAPYVERRIGTYRILSEEGLALIEHNADTILQEVGMDFRGDPAILDVLRNARADVRGENVRFDRGICRRIIQATAPREFTYHARNPARSVHFGGASAIFAPFMSEYPREGKLRSITNALAER